MKTLIFLFLAIFSMFASAQSKWALVIGNAAYQDSPLRNPVRDANAVAGALQSVGFTVLLKTDRNKEDMEKAVMEFSNKISHGDVALFCYFGHGMQVNNINYLIPVNEKIYSETDVPYKSVEMQYVIDQMEKKRASINILILDACRDNPFRSFRTLQRGFVAVTASTGTYIAYSTLPGNVASDGTGQNSPFTKSFINCIKMKDVPIETMFKEVRRKVLKETSGRQQPCEFNSLVENFSFNGETEPPPTPDIYNQIQNAITDYNNAYATASCGSPGLRTRLELVNHLAPEKIRICNKCDGDGKTVIEEKCKNCGGDGKVDCSSCAVNKRGLRFPGKMWCPVCQGWGGKHTRTYQPQRGWVDQVEGQCANCNGTGAVTCNQCRGTGSVSCGDCSNGIIRASACCSKCKGLGTVVVN
jgi:hypothetical protein